MSENKVSEFEKLLNESLENTPMTTGAIIKGEVVDISDDFVTVFAGLKSESPISIDQFYSMEGELEVSVGDEVDVALEAVEDGKGETRLSRERAKRAEAWVELERAHETNVPVVGLITARVKGGFTVEINKVRAFLPGSLVDVKPLRDPDGLVGQTMELKVIKIDIKRNNVVVSRRSVVETASSEEREALLKSLAEGQEVKGIVKNLTDYGAFIDLGGVDGLLHITDMSWKRIRHPSEMINIGDEITVKVLKFDTEKGRVSLGLKQLGEDPWLDIGRRFPISARLAGKVTNITDYGCFVEIEEGIEGLVHVSEMDWTNKNVNPGKVVHLGQEVEVMVLEIDAERRRISLGLKQCVGNPWETFAEMHQKGERIAGKIKSITDFGIFIGLEGGIDGLVHLSDISWDETGEEAIRNYKKGDELETTILAIDADRERISLGIKQLSEDPFVNYVEVNTKGSVVIGEVTEVTEKGAAVFLAERVEGYVRAADIAAEPVEDATEKLNVGDKVEAKIISIDRKARLVNLSIKAKDEKDTPESSATMAPPTNTTLGDLLKEQMEGKDK